MTVNGRTLILVTLMTIVTAALAATFFRSFGDAGEAVEPSTGEMELARGIFDRALTDPGGEAWAAEVAALGLPRSLGPEQFGAIALEEVATDCRGRGSYYLRTASPRSPILISAPHRGADRNTGTLALQLFAEGDYSAAAWNSAPRRSSDGCGEGIDLARQPDHYFTAFALAFADRYPEGRVIQLHGFDRAARNSVAAFDADIIASNGTERPSARLLDLADCLSTSLAPRIVAVYPNDAAELGALGNAQGQALQAAGFEGFTHLELAPDLRQELVADENLRARFASCFGSATP